MSRKNQMCPKCGSTNPIAIVYGMPDSSLVQEAEEGKVVLGGCCIEEGIPLWRCRKCGFEFGKMVMDNE